MNRGIHMTINPLGCYSTQKLLEVAIDDLIVTRFPSGAALRENADAIAELLYDSIETFAFRTGIRTSRFAEAYSASVRITLSTLDKPHLRGVCRFENLPIAAALRWLKSRLLSNLKTVLTNPKSSEWLGHADREQAAVEHVTFGNAEIEAELDVLSGEQVLTGLRTLFRDGADIGELEYLANRFGIDVNEAIGVYPTPIIVERSSNGNPQLCMDLGV